MDPRAFLRSLLDTAIQAALPAPSWFAGLEKPKERVVVVGAGKAAASMARALEAAWDGPLEGLVVTRYGHSVPTSSIEVVEAAHPVPDAVGVRAAERILQTVRGLTADDLVIALISGGGSSLLTLPALGITLEEKQSLARQLLASGAPIREINSVRKKLSAIKGGRLLEACAPARVLTFIVSDVPGDDPSVVASGPTLPWHAKPGEALEILRRHGIAVSESVSRVLAETVDEAKSYPPHEVRIVASAAQSLAAAARESEGQGIPAHVLSDRLEGEARAVGVTQARLAIDILENGVPYSAPCVILSGGETTVTVKGNGKGGRNVEFLAAMAQALEGRPNIYALAADTDGVDGSMEIAGAIIDPTTFTWAGSGLSEALANNDAHSLFQSLGDSIVTGPTLTNVNDFRAILLMRR